MTIDKDMEEYIRDAVQERLDEMFRIVDLPDYISACNFDEDEQEWADEHIGVRIIVKIV